MTAPLDLLISVVFGGAIALASRGQLRVSSRPWYATRYFASAAIFQGLLVLPAAAYRYFFHPDWAAMYLFEASKATVIYGIAGLGLVLGAGVGTFGLGNYCARTHREWLILTVMALAVAAVVLMVVLLPERLLLVGSYAQWHGSFGLRALAETDLLPAVLVMDGCVLVGWVAVLAVFVREGASFVRPAR